MSDKFIDCHPKRVNRMASPRSKRYLTFKVRSINTTQLGKGARALLEKGGRGTTVLRVFDDDRSLWNIFTEFSDIDIVDKLANK